MKTRVIASTFLLIIVASSFASVFVSAGSTQAYAGIFGPINQPPQVASFEGPSEAKKGELVCWKIKYFDFDNDAITSIIIDWDDHFSEQYPITDANSKSITCCHSYLKDGKYLPTVKVRDEHGQWSRFPLIGNAGKGIVITNQAPTCSITADVLTGYGSLNVTFNIRANDSDGKIVSYAIDFDNPLRWGAPVKAWPGNNFNTTYEFKRPGNYTVVLFVDDDSGDTTIDKIIIKVLPESERPKEVAEENNDNDNSLVLLGFGILVVVAGLAVTILLIAKRKKVNKNI